MATPQERLEFLRKKKRLAELRAKAAGQQVTTQQPAQQPSLIDRASDFFESDERKGDLLSIGATSPVAAPIAAVASAINPVSAGEGLLAAATGLVGTVAGGLSGLATSLNPLTDATGAQVSRDVQEALTFQPRAKRSQEDLKKFGETLTELTNKPIAGVAGLTELARTGDPNKAVSEVKEFEKRGFGDVAGERAADLTGSPLVGTAVKLLPDIASSVVGGPIATTAAKQALKPNAFKQKLIESLKSGQADPATAKFKLAKSIVTGGEKLAKSKTAKDALKQGFEADFVSMIKGSNKSELSKMRQMVSVLERGRSDRLFRDKNRPSDVAGKSLSSRIKFIKKENIEAGKAIDKAARSLKGKNINLTQETRTFFDELNDMGVGLTQSQGKIKPRFKTSDIEFIPPARKLVRDLITVINRSDGPVDAFQAHRFKRIIDENVTFGKSDGGLSGKAEQVAKQLRVSIDDKLDNQFPDYNQVNVRYSDTISALDAFQDVAGQKMNLFGPNSSKAIGTLTRRATGNAQSRIQLIDAMDEIDRVTAKSGKVFDDDILRQVSFVNELDRFFGATASTSFKAQISEAIPLSKSEITARVAKTPISLNSKLKRKPLTESQKHGTAV